MDLELAAFILLLGAVVHLTIEVRRIKRRMEGTVRDGKAVSLPGWFWYVAQRQKERASKGRVK